VSAGRGTGAGGASVFDDGARAGSEAEMRRDWRRVGVDAARDGVGNRDTGEEMEGVRRSGNGKMFWNGMGVGGRFSLAGGGARGGLSGRIGRIGIGPGD
jgi:hypothetical protein